MVNDAGLYELSWEAVVMLFGFLQIWMVSRECWGICGVTTVISAIKPEMDDGCVLQTDI